jgi:putative hydrolase of the HAD superfamily
MKYKTVIFDLFGTLVPSFSSRDYRLKVIEVADGLSAPAEKLWQLWYDTMDRSILGSYPSLEAKVTDICHKLDLRPNESDISKAVLALARYSIEKMTPRAEAFSVISQLKTAGYKIGLITDCGAEVPEAWEKLDIAPLFDVKVFSCLAGRHKPDPEIYHLAASELGVRMPDCIYIGDGSSQELTGASRVGMHPVQLYIEAEADPDVMRFGQEKWPGTRISSLSELPPLVKRLEPQIDLDLVKIVTAKESDYEFAYQVKKAAEGHYISELWGWDEAVQRDYQSKVWKVYRPDIITYSGKPIGTVAIVNSAGQIEIEQFFILPEYQSLGIGSMVLKPVLSSADSYNMTVKLKCLKNNPAVSLYQRLGFRITGSEDSLLLMGRRPLTDPE